MTKTGTTIVITVVMVDGVIMMDGVEGAVVDGGRVPISAFTLDRLTPPTDTMRILLHMGITDILHTGTTDTRTEAHTPGLAFWVEGHPDGGRAGHLSTPSLHQTPIRARAALSATRRLPEPRVPVLDRTLGQDYMRAVELGDPCLTKSLRASERIVGRAGRLIVLIEHLGADLPQIVFCFHFVRD
jgi:hypothetical protein